MSREHKYRVITDAGVFYAPTDSFSLVLHDTGHLLQMWCSDGIVDEIPVKDLHEFTGLKDKNGAEIYSSDIIKFYYDFDDEEDRIICKVVFESAGHSNTLDFHALRLDGEIWEYYGGMPSTDDYLIEVIGNIYENPELLENNNE